MVPAFDDEEPSATRSERRDERRELGGRPERVARTLDEEHRRPHARQVRRSQLVRPARRVQRVPEENETREIVDRVRSFGRGHLASRCDPPSTCPR